MKTLFTKKIIAIYPTDYPTGIRIIQYESYFMNHKKNLR